MQSTATDVSVTLDVTPIGWHRNVL